MARAAPPPSRSGAVDVDGVRRRARAEEPRLHDGAATRGVIRRLDHQHRRALAQDEAAATAIERPRHVRRGAQAVEAGDEETAERVGTAGEHDVGAAPRDPVGRERHRMGARGAGELRRGHRTARPDGAGDADRGRPVRNAGDALRRSGPGIDRGVPALEDREPARGRPERHPEAAALHGRRIETGILEGLPGGTQRAASRCGRDPRRPPCGTSAATPGCRSAAGNARMGAMAVRPAVSPSQNAATPVPNGVTTPQPVTRAERRTARGCHAAARSGQRRITP